MKNNDGSWGLWVGKIECRMHPNSICYQLILLPN